MHHWIPRGLAIAFIIFVSLFALDALGTGQPFQSEVAGLLIHLIPSFVLLAALAVAWRNERMGGIAFLILYLAAILFFRGEVITVLLFAPLVIIGALFLRVSKKTTYKN